MLKVELPTDGHTTWSTVWPITEGIYWFYGYPWGKKLDDYDHGPDLCCVNVRRISNGVIHLAEGYTLYREEGCVGVWAPVDLPSKPGTKGH